MGACHTLPVGRFHLYPVGCEHIRHDTYLYDCGSIFGIPRVFSGGFLQTTPPHVLECHSAFPAHRTQTLTLSPPCVTQRHLRLQSWWRFLLPPPL